MRPILLAILLTGCSQLAPYEWVPREARKGPDEALPRIGVCYNAMFTTPDEVRAVAEEACAGIGVPQLVEQDMRLACPLFTPVRATFACLSPTSEPR
ncbi:MAG: hypothetical protein IRZ04_08330 [Rhodospirillales bacterium]|nr:hypothetical protein [Rhodospirillales bacterium]